METNKDYEKLRELEESLWRTETRFDQQYMNEVLALDFFEFGRSGRMYKREDTLKVAPEPINAKLPLKSFEVHCVDESVALVTYISEVTYDEVEIATRSSLWLKTATGWKLKFHQGTPVIQ